MEEIRNCLIVARKEYTNILVDLLYRPIYVGIQSIWEDSKKSSKPRDAYRKFQERLLKIPKWNQPVITKEYNRIVDKTKCEYLDELIKKVFILHTQLLATHSVDPNRKIRLSVPKTDDFIHKCYETCGKSFFENPILMEDRPNVLESRKRIRNLQESNTLIKDCIQTTIRSMLPVGNLLKEDDNNQEGEDISPSPELYQRISAFNNMYHHDKLTNDTKNPENWSPTHRPLDSLPTLTSILKTANENTLNAEQQFNPILDRKNFVDVPSDTVESDKESDKNSESVEDVQKNDLQTSDKAPPFGSGFKEENKNEEMSMNFNDLFSNRRRKHKLTNFGTMFKDNNSADSDSENENKNEKINNDLATNLTNNADPIPNDKVEKTQELQKIDLDVNSETEELPIRIEKQSTDDSQQKVPPIENFDSANFFSDNE